MASIGGRRVVHAGVLQFQGDEIAKAGTVPEITVSADHNLRENPATNGPGPNGVAVTLHYDPGSESVAVLGFEFGDRKYKLYYDARRMGDLPDGPFYRFSYTLTEG